MRTADRDLMWHGMLLFLIGLVTGLMERRFTNMRMALSAHLEGVMNGTFLIAVAAIWGHVELPPRVEKVARWSALYGTYGNWLFTTFGAAAGTAAANPILSQGHHGRPWQERVAAAGFRSVSYSILLAVVLMLWGLGRRRSTPATDAATRTSVSTTKSTTADEHQLTTN
ncbi:hydrogenase [Mycobacterium sp. NPDC048908]|uniref:hydrogenase n=1 Tax=Mycobacterium sp. NPDC048908 TaxID=3364292 RepID=UPI003719A031